MLNDTIVIKNVTLKNRIIAEPVVSESATRNGYPTPESLDIYKGYAESGAGLVVVEQHSVHPWGRVNRNQFNLYDDAPATALEPLTKLFRDNDMPVTAQINYGGAGAARRALLEEADFELVSPSGLRTPRDLIKEDPRTLALAEITQIVASFAGAAKRAVKLAKYSGGVQIYACHGYLIGQFLSPITNQRTDRYGGSLRNRSRLLLEIVEAVQAVIGDYPLSVRLGASDRMPNEPEKGLTLAEGVRVAEELAKMGVDWLGVSGNHCIYGIGANDDDTAYFAPYARAIREAVKKYGVYVDCAGGIRTPQTAEKMLQSRACDLIGIGRPFIADKSFLSDWGILATP